MRVLEGVSCTGKCIYGRHDDSLVVCLSTSVPADKGGGQPAGDYGRGQMSGAQ